MTNAFSLLRSLIIYGVCLPMAIFIGYMLATPTDLSTYASVGLLLGLMTIPLFLRWHYPWLILCWNTTAGLYFLPGKPSLALVMIFVSFAISLLAYIMNRNSKFITVPSVARPLIFLLIVVVGTAKLTNSLGLNVLGSDTMGGKRYIYLFAAITGYFALVAEHIPAHKVDLYVKLFFLGALTAAVGSMLSIISPDFYFIFLIFPADTSSLTRDTLDSSQITRLGGVSAACSSIAAYMLARYGVEGVLDIRRYGRFLIFISLAVLRLFGGFRSQVIDLLLLCSILFYMEGLFRTRLLPVVLMAAILTASIVIPFSNKLPLSVQRSLAFLPLDLDKDAVINAQASTDWRLEMWANILPMVPHYLILGKGLGIDPREMQLANQANSGGEVAAGSTLAGDYHSGPLSLIMPFGLAGVIGFVWFLGASIRVLYRNYKYGDPEQVRINRFLFAYFLIRILVFIFIFGSFYSDLAFFVGPVGLSIAINGGVRKPAEEPVTRQVVQRFRLATAVR